MPVHPIVARQTDLRLGPRTLNVSEIDVGLQKDVLGPSRMNGRNVGIARFRHIGDGCKLFKFNDDLLRDVLRFGPGASEADGNRLTYKTNFTIRNGRVIRTAEPSRL